MKKYATTLEVQDDKGNAKSKPITIISSQRWVASNETASIALNLIAQLVKQKEGEQIAIYERVAGSGTEKVFIDGIE